jgi:hypothetical protein
MDTSRGTTWRQRGHSQLSLSSHCTMHCWWKMCIHGSVTRITSVPESSTSAQTEHRVCPSLCSSMLARLISMTWFELWAGPTRKAIILVTVGRAVIGVSHPARIHATGKTLLSINFGSFLARDAHVLSINDHCYDFSACCKAPFLKDRNVSLQTTPSLSNQSPCFEFGCVLARIFQERIPFFVLKTRREILRHLEGVINQLDKVKAAIPDSMDLLHGVGAKHGSFTSRPVAVFLFFFGVVFSREYRADHL